MCGIIGLVGEPNAAVSQKTVRQMTAAVALRGPDDEGFWTSTAADLGHRRLAIFDLSPAGHQPMVTSDGAVAIVFNGAIYNFHELRHELELSGCVFHSRTDTEVLLEGYRAWGIDTLVERIRGMFAFAIWDERQRQLFLVRDRLGVKPIFYSIHDGRIAFASSARAFRDAGWARELDPQAIIEFLEYGYVTEARSIYLGVHKLPAATVLSWREGQAQMRSYWSPPEAADYSRITFDDAVAETERLFLQAVERRLFADVPVCALLSGGVDSSLVCWAIAQLGSDITAFTIGTPGDPWDESSDARLTAQELGIRHRVLAVNSNSPADVQQLVAAYAEPFACASALGMLNLSKAIRREATVVVTGDGGDDVFLGYPEHRHLQLAERTARMLPSAIASSWRSLRKLVPQAGILRRARHFLDYATGGLGAFVAAHEGLPEIEADYMLGERLRGHTVDARCTPWSHRSAARVLSDFLVHDRHGRFVSEYLTKVDGATMYCAVEARSPFLDTDLWEFAAGLPYGLRLQGGRPKAILRELARRRIGNRIASGVKRGFGIPVQRWIAGQWYHDVERQLSDSLLHQEGWLDAPAVLRRLRVSKVIGWAPKRIWYAYVLERWLREERAHAEAQPTTVVGT